MVNIYVPPKIYFVNPRVWSIIRTKLGGDPMRLFCLKLYNLQMPESVGAWKGIVHSFLRETTSSV